MSHSVGTSPPAVGEMRALIDQLDGSVCSAGAPESWPVSLRTAVNICLDSRHPLEIWWGPDYLRFYNDAYRPILGASKHPYYLGRPGRECWPEVWDQVGQMLDSVRLTGEAIFHENFNYNVHRNGFLEETYFTASYSALRIEDGSIGGILTVVNETTPRVFAERRLRTLKELADRNNLARELEECCRVSAEALSSNPKDIPFCQIYLIDEAFEHAMLTAQSGQLPTHSQLSKEQMMALDFDDRWPVGRVARTGEAETIHLPHRPANLQPPDEEAVPRAGWPEEPKLAQLMPLWLRGRSRPIGVLVLGANPRCAYDQVYADFMGSVAAQISEDLDQSRVAAERRTRLLQQAERDRNDRARLYEIFMKAPAFIAVMRGPDQVFELANEHYYELVGHRELLGKTSREAFPEVEGQGFFELAENVLKTGNAFVGSDLCAKLQRVPGGPLEDRFIDLTFQPLYERDGTISGVLGHGIDITERKQAEQERLRLLELERQSVVELESQRDQLAHANSSLRGASEALRHQQELQAVVLRYLRSANQASAALTKALTSEEIVESMLKVLRNGFYANIASFYLYDLHSQSLKLAGGFGLDPTAPVELASEIKLSSSSSCIARVGRSGHALVTNASAIEGDFDPGWLAENNLVSAAIFPLSFHDSLGGVTVAFFANYLPTEAEAVLATLTSVAAVSLGKLTQSSQR